MFSRGKDWGVLECWGGRQVRRREGKRGREGGKGREDGRRGRGKEGDGGGGEREKLEGLGEGLSGPQPRGGMRDARQKTTAAKNPMKQCKTNALLCERVSKPTTFTP